jgi:hypothetical protein
VGLFQERLIFAGSASAPTTVWGSQTGDLENFQDGDLDTSALIYQLASAQQNPAQWIEAITNIHIGTSGNEEAVTSGTTGLPLTPTNVGAWPTSSFGSAYLQPVLAERKILFVERQGRRIREMGEVFIYANPDSVLVPDLTILAEHILTSGVTDMDVAHLPDNSVYCVRADGQMAVLTYNREQQVTAWARFVTAGTFESVCTVDDTPSDQVWVIVNRTINGTPHRFVERFAPFLDPSQLTITNATMFFVDCGILLVNGSPSVNVTGLAHLNGMAVAVLADGIVVPGLTVSGGAITLPIAATTVIVGLPYTGTLETMKIDVMGQQGTSQGKRKAIGQFCIRFKDTLGAQLIVTAPRGAAARSPEVIPFRATTDLMDNSVPLFTGDKVLSYPGGPNLSQTIKIQQTNPLPMTVLALFPVVNDFGE